MSETTKNAQPLRFETDIAGLTLIQMLSREDDEAHFDLQNKNIEYWSEFGNTIDESVDAVTARRLEHGNGRFGIWHEGKLIGMVGYSTKDHENEAELGILLDKDAAGHGYATVALKTLTDYASSLFERVFAEIDPDNAKSIDLVKRVGYTTDGEVVARDWGRALVFEAAK